MKTLKAVTVLLFTAALFFSCAQEDIGDYGTLVINPSGGKSARSVEAGNGGIPDDIFEKLEYIFECENEKAGTVTAGPYTVDGAHDVRIPLSSGNWIVSVKVRQEGQEIGKAQYEPVTIKAGQTVILGGISVETFPYGYAKAGRAPDGFTYTDLNAWLGIPTTININRHLQVTGGDPDPDTPDNYYVDAPEGTAKILWDSSYLYVLVLVKGADCSPTKGAGAHDTDSVEIFFNENGTGYQYRMDYAGTDTYGKSGTSYTSQPTPFSEKAADLSIETDTAKLPPGVSYAVTARIPFGATTKAKGEKIGVDFQINGAPKAGSQNRSSVTVWYYKKGQVYNSPNAYKETLTLN